MGLMVSSLVLQQKRTVPRGINSWRESSLLKDTLDTRQQILEGWMLDQAAHVFARQRTIYLFDVDILRLLAHSLGVD